MKRLGTACLAALSLAAACSERDLPTGSGKESPRASLGASGEAARIVVHHGGQTMIAGCPLDKDVTFTVLDATGQPVSGVTVTLQPTGGGVATPAVATTNANGVARTSWRLRPAGGAD